MGKTLQFNKAQNLSIEGAEYRVTGGIEFHNRSDGSRWWEYCLLETRTRGIKWLSIDNIYEEYAIYTQCPYGSEFDEMNIFRDGYRQADAGQAVVTSCFGQVDTSPGDTVRYTEYEDGTEELIIAVEQWEDETEYSKGCYLDMDEIVLLDSGCSGQVESNRTLGFVNMKNLAVAAVILAVLGVLSYTYIQSNKKTIHKYLEGNINFSYQTSITSDLNEKERADVYSTDLSVDDAAKAIIQAIDGGTEDVQKNGEDDSVAILTKSEYCLVYTSTDQTTMVQISSRAYVYQSTNTPYHATGHTHSYYRRELTGNHQIHHKCTKEHKGRAQNAINHNCNKFCHNLLLFDLVLSEYILPVYFLAFFAFFAYLPELIPPPDERLELMLLWRTLSE